MSLIATCFIVPLSFSTTLSASTTVTELAVVSPSRIFNSAVVEVTPSNKFNSVAVLVTPSNILSSEAVDVTPSKIFNSAAVEVTAVLLIDSTSVSNVPVTFAPPSVTLNFSAKLPSWFWKTISLLVPSVPSMKILALTLPPLCWKLIPGVFASAVLWSVMIALDCLMCNEVSGEFTSPIPTCPPGFNKISPLPPGSSFILVLLEVTIVLSLIVI